MDANRERIIEIIKANEGIKKLNRNITDSAIRMYDDKSKLSDVYENIVADPVPFLLFLLKIKELKEEQKANQSVLI